MNADDHDDDELDPRIVAAIASLTDADLAKLDEDDFDFVALAAKVAAEETRPASSRTDAIVDGREALRTRHVPRVAISGLLSAAACLVFLVVVVRSRHPANAPSAISPTTATSSVAVSAPAVTAPGTIKAPAPTSSAQALPQPSTTTNASPWTSVPIDNVAVGERVSHTSTTEGWDVRHLSFDGVLADVLANPMCRRATEPDPSNCFSRLQVVPPVGTRSLRITFGLNDSARSPTATASIRVADEATNAEVLLATLDPVRSQTVVIDVTNIASLSVDVFNDLVDEPSYLITRFDSSPEVVTPLQPTR